MPNETIPAAEVTMTAARLKKEFADVHQEVLKTGHTLGVAAEKQRFSELQAACGGDHELLVQCFAEGQGVTDALKARNDKLTRQLAAAEKAGATNTTATPAVDPAVTEFAEQTPAPAAGDEHFDEARATDDDLKARFMGDGALQDRFSCAEAYIAHVRHPAK